MHVKLNGFLCICKELDLRADVSPNAGAPPWAGPLKQTTSLVVRCLQGKSSCHSPDYVFLSLAAPSATPTQMLQDKYVLRTRPAVGYTTAVRLVVALMQATKTVPENRRKRNYSMRMLSRKPFHHQAMCATTRRCDITEHTKCVVAPRAGHNWSEAQIPERRSPRSPVGMVGVISDHFSLK